MTVLKWALYHRPRNLGMGWQLFCNSGASSGREAIDQEFTNDDSTVYWNTGADGSPEKPASVWGTSEACFVPFRSHGWLARKARDLHGFITHNCGLPGVRLSKGKFIRIDDLCKEGDHDNRTSIPCNRRDDEGGTMQGD